MWTKPRDQIYHDTTIISSVIVGKQRVKTDTMTVRFAGKNQLAFHGVHDCTTTGMEELNQIALCSEGGL